MTTNPPSKKKSAVAKKPVKAKTVQENKVSVDLSKVSDVPLPASKAKEEQVLIKVNDVKSLPLRRRMLRWFKISKK